MKIDVLYEDNHLLIVNKAPGWLSQGDKTNDITILEPYKKYLKDKYAKPGNVYLHPAHRLDRPVSGCLILGRTTKGLSRVQQLFKNNEVQKEYVAIVHQGPKDDAAELNNWILKDRSKNRSLIRQSDMGGAKYATLTYRILRRNKDLSLLLIRPTTGRSHQIRVQLSHIKCPILYDMKYGSSVENASKSIALHCYKLVFKHPTQDKMIEVRSIPPNNSNPWKQFKRILTTI